MGVQLQVRGAERRAEGAHGRRALAGAVVEVPVVREAPAVGEAPDVLVLVDLRFF